MIDSNLTDLERITFYPLQRTTTRFWALIAAFGAIGALGAYAYSIQLSEGLGVTGLDRPVYWGVYLTNFVFFTGISMAGTLISAILRVTHAEWRRSITRIAEAITAFALLLGVLQILFDLGRVDRVMNVLVFGRFQSPMLWDFTCIGVYFLCSVMYLYLPMLPDLARLRDRMSGAAAWRRWLYRTLALGWRGNVEQFRRLEKSIALMAVLLIPIAAMVHTVVAWLFGMTLQPMWHSTIFGPYFIVGAIFSGTALLLLFMTLLRRAWHLENYIGEEQYNYLGWLLVAMSTFWLYFTLAENLTAVYGGVVDEMNVERARLLGDFRVLFWGMIFLNGVVPFAVLVWRRTPLSTAVASVSVVLGMWIERFLIVVPSVTHPRLTDFATYLPTWVEMAVTAGSFALFALLYISFFKLFPAISLWEIEATSDLRAVSSEIIQSTHNLLPSNE